MSLQGTHRGCSRWNPETEEADFDFNTALRKLPPKNTLLGTMELAGNDRLGVGKDHRRRGTEKSV